MKRFERIYRRPLAIRGALYDELPHDGGVAVPDRHTATPGRWSTFLARAFFRLLLAVGVAVVLSQRDVKGGAVLDIVDVEVLDSPPLPLNEARFPLRVVRVVLLVGAFFGIQNTESARHYSDGRRVFGRMPLVPVGI